MNAPSRVVLGLLAIGCALANAAFSSALDVGIGTPGAVATDSAGNVYFSAPNVVFRLDAERALSRVVGGRQAGYSGDGGPASTALLNMPMFSYPELAADPFDNDPLIAGIAIDRNGNLLVADTYNNRVRKVTPGGLITTVAGNGTRNGFADIGDGGRATDSQLSWPQGVATDANGQVYVTTVWGTVRRITADGVDHFIATPNCGPGYLGPGACVPEGVTVGADGSVYFADGYCRVRRIPPSGQPVTVAGDDADPDGHGFAFTCGHTSDSGPATKAALNFPYGVALDGAGDLIIADSYNHCIRKVDTTGNISTIAGTCGMQGFGGDGGAATLALLNTPFGVAIDGAGTLYIADTLNGRIRKVVADGRIVTIAGNGGAVADNVPYQPLPATAATIGRGYTGSWYDPAQSGHGLHIEVLPDNRFYAAWFAFNPAGTQQAWFAGVGTYGGNTATITSVELPSGGHWIPNFDPSQVAHSPWGTLTFTFTDCDHGRVDFNSVAGYGSGSMNLTRLTQPMGLTCP